MGTYDFYKLASPREDLEAMKREENQSAFRDALHRAITDKRYKLAVFDESIELEIIFDSRPDDDIETRLDFLANNLKEIAGAIAREARNIEVKAAYEDGRKAGRR